MVRANTLGASAIAAAITFAVASLEPARTGAADLWSKRKAVNDEQLDNMRGGFEAPDGLQVSFGIERAVYINGELVAVTRLVVSNLPNLLKGGIASAQAFANAFTVVQNGPGNSVENQSAPAASVAASPSLAAVPTPSTPATVSDTPVGAPTPSPLAAVSGTGAPAPSTSAAVSAAPVGATASSAGAPASSTSAAVSAAPVGATTSSAAASAGANQAASSGLQSLQFNGQTLVLPNPTAIVTAVQNSLNNQVIQTRTSIDATMNSLSFLRSGAFADALRQQTLLSVRR